MTLPEEADLRWRLPSSRQPPPHAENSYTTKISIALSRFMPRETTVTAAAAISVRGQAI